MQTTTTHVRGMTCGHCVAAVSDEVRAIDNVTDVTVELETGKVEITTDGALDPQALAAAIDEAGYELA